jgi:hypothetical protein
MKVISVINYLALAIPFLIALFGLLTSNEDYYIYALFSTAGTGAIQVLLALSMLFYYRSILLTTYLTITALFFTMWYFIGEESWLIAIPLILAIFLTYIIHIEKNREVAASAT